MRLAGEMPAGGAATWPSNVDRRSVAGSCPPLVCTEGWPSDAARLLLGELRAAGWEIRHHRDLDLGGVAIVRHLSAEVGATQWRFDPESYDRALKRVSDASLPAAGTRKPLGAVPERLHG